MTPITGTSGFVRGVRIASGKMYLFGRGDSFAGGFKGFLARLDDAGAFDPTFGTGGFVTTDYEIKDAQPTPAGKWIVTGANYAQQLMSNGAKDTTFGSSSYILNVSPLADAGYVMDTYSVGVDTSGRLSALIGSTSHDRLELWSIGAAGQRLTSFAGTGSIILDTPGENPVPLMTRHTVDGRSLAVGLSSYYPAESVLMRFFP